MRKAFTLFLHFFAAVLVTFVLASLFHSQFVLHELTRLGVEITIQTRITSSMEDLIGLLPGYGAVITVSLLLGFLIIWGVRRFRPSLTVWSYAAGGFTAMLVAHIAMYPIMNITLIAGARSDLGLLCQCVAGLCGGAAFAYERSKIGRYPH